MPPTGARRYRVCCVADDRDAARSLADVFEGDAFDPVPVWSIGDVTETIVAEDVDCLVTSYDLGGDDGYALVRLVRRSWPRLPVVLYGDVDPADVPGSARVTSAAFVSHREGDRPRERLRRETRAAIEADSGDTVGLTRSAYVEFDDVCVHAGVLLESLLECFPAHCYIKDAEGRHVAVSRSLIDDPDDVLGKRDTELEFVPDDQATAAYRDDVTVIEEERPLLDKEEQVTERGQWDLTSKVPLYGEADDEPIGLVGITHDITAQKRAERELERQNDRLERFASLVSHDLRNPLSVAMGRLELVRDEHDSEHLEEIQWAIERMDELIEEMLALARHGRTVLESDLVDLDAVARAAERTIDAPALELTVDPIAPIKADETRLQRMLENLFRNSADHGVAAEGDRIRVTVGRLEDARGFFVADDGVGIPPDEREAVFEAGHTTAEGGTGFGLAIAEEIAAAHGWSIDVVDSEDGSGARFEITGVTFATEAPGAGGDGTADSS